ncbi:MAG TPA: hypothetical protein VMF14_14055 [Solirubrobacteraceae bacterium]|nr:hypothetical protein [Solirubrobacteraceae bacterium]
MAVTMVATAAAGLAVASTALAASPPTITSAFTPSQIGLSDSAATALSFTITNPNASGTLAAVSFTDTLPAGLAVDDPNGENGTCGSSGVITANPASQAISLSGGSIKAGASCTFSVSVTAAQTGTFQSTTSAVSSSAGASSTGAAATLTVIPPPTVTVGHIRNNAKYTYGQVVKPTYSCTQPDDPSGLTDCSAEDDLGNDIASGGALKTKIPGSHSLTVSATSDDGAVTTDEIDYTVLPDNQFAIAKLKPQSHGALQFQLALPGAGKIKVVELAGKKTFGQFSGSVAGQRKLHVTVKPTPAGSALLKQTPSVKVTLQVTYTPKGGVKHTVTRRGITLSAKK